MLKKSLYFFLALLMIFTLSFNVVEARGLNDDSSIYALDGNDSQDAGCDAIFGDPTVDGTFANYLQQIFNVMKFLAPSLVVVLSIVEFVKAIASEDKDALAKATKKTGKRIFLALMLFFIPSLINFFFELLGWYGTCGIG